jgi:cytochrome P450
MFGPGSTFSLDGTAHRERRKLLVPPFHGKRMASYEGIIEQEVLREIAKWPEGREFETMPSMMHITLNAILRTVFGAEGAALDELRELLPPMVLNASRLAVMPPLVRRDFGAWSPGRKLTSYRERYDEIIGRLIADIRNDPKFDERNDVLALMLQAQYEDGSPISDDHIADELLTLLAAGHETTATTLAWTVERLRRHPRLLARLTAEVDAGESELLQATIWEVQRTRPVINGTARMTKTRIRLGEWVIPERHAVLASISLAHASEDSFADAKTFSPDRFVGSPPDNYAWIPYGGGVRRCIGAAFANMEMTVTLRTLLRDFEFGTTYAPGERLHSRGVATAPAHGGRAVVYRRATKSAEAAGRIQRVSA